MTKVHLRLENMFERPQLGLQATGCGASQQRVCRRRAGLNPVQERTGFHDQVPDLRAWGVIILAVIREGQLRLHL